MATKTKARINKTSIKERPEVESSFHYSKLELPKFLHGPTPNTRTVTARVQKLFVRDKLFQKSLEYNSPKEKPMSSGLIRILASKPRRPAVSNRDMIENTLFTGNLSDRISDLRVYLDTLKTTSNTRITSNHNSPRQESQKKRSGFINTATILKDDALPLDIRRLLVPVKMDGDESKDTFYDSRSKTEASESKQSRAGPRRKLANILTINTNSHATLSSKASIIGSPGEKLQSPIVFSPFEAKHDENKKLVDDTCRNFEYFTNAKGIRKNIIDELHNKIRAYGFADSFYGLSEPYMPIRKRVYKELKKNDYENDNSNQPGHIKPTIDPDTGIHSGKLGALKKLNEYLRDLNLKQKIQNTSATEDYINVTVDRIIKKENELFKKCLSSGRLNKDMSKIFEITDVKLKLREDNLAITENMEIFEKTHGELEYVRRENKIFNKSLQKTFNKINNIVNI